MLTTMLFAVDHDRVVAFYVGVFGLQVDPAASLEGYTVLVGDGARLSVHAVPTDVAATISLAEPPEPRRSTAVKLLFDVDELAAVGERVVQLGGQLFETAGEGVADGCDVEGNMLRLTEVPR